MTSKTADGTISIRSCQHRLKQIMLCTVCLFCMAKTTVTGQDLLTLDQAVALAMKDNLDIELEKFDAEIARNNVTHGNAGQLPTVDLQGSYDYNYILQQNVDAGEALLPDSDAIALGGSNLVSSTLQGAATINYVIFNGFQGRYRYQQLQTQSQLAEKELQQAMEDVFVDIVEAYFEVAKHQSTLLINLESIRISQERLARTQTANEYSRANQLEVLQAQVDLNEDSIDYDNTLLAYEQSKQQLAELLNLPYLTDFSVSETISLRAEPFTHAQLLGQMQENNVTLAISKYNVNLAYQDLKLEEAQRFPTLSASAGMNYNRQAAENAFPELQESYGPALGLSLSYRLYDGKQRKVKRKNAQLTADRYETQLQSTARHMETQLANTHRNYENYHGQLRKARANLASYERNFQKAREDYGLASITGTELRNAQVNLMNAKNRIATLTFDLKVVETNLLKLSGQLLTNE